MAKAIALITHLKFACQALLQMAMLSSHTLAGPPRIMHVIEPIDQSNGNKIPSR